MRKWMGITMFVVLAAGLSSCEKIKSIFDVEFDTTLSGDLDISIQESAMKSTAAYSFSTTTDVNPLDDPDIEEYIDNIKDFDIKEVVAEVVYVNKGSVTFGEGTVITIYDDIDEATWPVPGNWEITEGTTLSLEDVSNVYKKVATILNRKKSFTISASGTCSDTGVEIVIRVAIDTKVIANPL